MLLKNYKIKKKLFKNAISHGFNISISIGSQTPPIVGAGDKLKWKKAQKNAKKNIIAKMINNIIFIRKPCCTILVIIIL